MRDEPNLRVKVPNCTRIRYHKGLCWFILTAGRWPWKSEPAKECVTTHLPNESAPKILMALQRALTDTRTLQRDYMIAMSRRGRGRLVNNKRFGCESELKGVQCRSWW